MRRRAQLAAMATACALASGCATPFDYAAYRGHMPRSILVLPPLNESTEVQATYSYLSTISQPLGECGYYVLPVAVMDVFMKENGLPTPGEMHEVSLAKLREITGADAVLYVTIEAWGQKYQVIQSTTVVKARAKLVDASSGTVIWTGTVEAQEGSGGGGGSLIGMAIAAVVDQVVDRAFDAAHALSRPANRAMVFHQQNGLLYGHYHPEYEADQRGR